MQKNGSVESRFGSLKESVRNLVDAGGERAGQFKDRAMGVKDSVFESSSAAMDRVGTLIKQHPIAALGIAFSLGYLAIRMMRNR
jgi:hypothetical protein